MTINEGLSYMKQLHVRQRELIELRNRNSASEERLFGEAKTYKRDPVYDVKNLDKMINEVGKEIRILDMAIKATNAVTAIANYTQNENVWNNIE